MANGSSQMASLKSAIALLNSFLLALLVPRPMNVSADLGSRRIDSSKSAMALSYSLFECQARPRPR